MNKQNLAMAYAMKRRAQKAHGGMIRAEAKEGITDPLEPTDVAMCAHGGPKHCNAGCYMAFGGKVDVMHEGEDEKYDPEIEEDAKEYMAKGGMVNPKLHEAYKADGGMIEDEDIEGDEMRELGLFDEEYDPQAEQLDNEKYDPDPKLAEEEMKEQKARKMARGGRVLSKILGSIGRFHKGA